MNDVNNNLQKEVDKLTESNQKMTEFVNDEVNKIIDKSFDDQIRLGKIIENKFKQEKQKNRLFDTDGDSHCHSGGQSKI